MLCLHLIQKFYYKYHKKQNIFFIKKLNNSFIEFKISNALYLIIYVLLFALYLMKIYIFKEKKKLLFVVI
jgi:hypothetical protein